MKILPFKIRIIILILYHILYENINVYKTKEQFYDTMTMCLSVFTSSTASFLQNWFYLFLLDPTYILCIKLD